MTYDRQELEVMILLAFTFRDGGGLSKDAAARSAIDVVNTMKTGALGNKTQRMMQMSKVIVDTEAKIAKRSRQPKSVRKLVDKKRKG